MKSSLLALLGSASTALAAVRGFNYAAQEQDYASFAAQFRTAASLRGADQYNSARLYTMIQAGTANTPISAIQAAIDTDSTLLLGLWASQDQAGFSNEIIALKSAIDRYGTQFTDRVIGISVGSEDLYRISPTGIANKSPIGQEPSVLVDYIRQTRQAIQGTTLGNKPVGHVDTWNVYVNGSNANVIAACDFLGLDEYPYFETTNENSIDNAKNLFFQAYDRVAAVSQGKSIWITEAGWPTSGPASKLAVASVDNAERFWQDVACELDRRQINTWWYILADAGASPSFGVSNNGQPLYDLTCKAPTTTSSTTTVAVSSTTSSSTATVTTGTAVTPTGPTLSTTTVISTTGGSGSSTIGGSSTTMSTSQSTTSRPATTTTTTAAPGATTFPGAASQVEGSIVALIVCAMFAAFVL